MGAANYKFRDFAIPSYMGPGLDHYIENGGLPGEFLIAVLENNLSEAVGYADSTNLHNLPAYVGYLYNEAPAACWGSKEKVAAWVAAKEALRAGVSA